MAEVLYRATCPAGAFSRTGDLGAFITLDSERDQVFTAYANADSGATVWVANEKHDGVALVNTSSRCWK